MALSERRIWLDGELVPWERATLHVLAQSVQRGSLVFDVMACYRRAGAPVVLGLREHAERFLGSAGLAGMQLGLDLPALLAAIGEAVRANPGADVVKVSAYHAGFALDVLPASRVPTVAIAAFAFADVLPAGRPTLARPAELQIAESIKMPARVLPPRLKVAAGYTHGALAKQRARDAGFDDVLFLDERGAVAESSTQSFFLVEHGVVRTASTDVVLDGITRRAVIELVQDEGIPLKEEAVPAAALARIEEAFLAGTSSNVWAVGRIGERRLPVPVPGPVTQRLQRRFQSMLAGDDPVFSPRWLQPV